MLYFDQILQKNPHHLKSLVKKGNVLGKLGKYERAITFYDDALQIESNNVLALLNKGLALHYIGKFDDAIACYDKVLQIKPNNATALYNKASSLILQNKVEEGLHILKQAIKVDYSFKIKAKYDIDFQGIKTRNEFKRIVL